MPGCAITTDIIAGFVGETEEEFAQTMALVEEVGFARIHVFPYSKRAGTRAASMPGHLKKAVKQERAHALIALGKRLEQAYLMQAVGTVQRVLIEETCDGAGEGYTDTYIRTRVMHATSGLVDAKITQISDQIAIATLV